MERTFKRIAILTLGWILVILGVAGLFLPFLQGILFLLAGLWVLSLESEWAHRLFVRLGERFPNAHVRLQHLKDRVRSRWRRPPPPEQ
jgi:uncharacterized protein